MVQRLPLSAFSSVGGTTFYQATGQTYMFFTKGQQPRVDVISFGVPVHLLDCSISGYY